MKQKILLFESRDLCYESNRYFMDLLEEALEELGQPVLKCDLSEDCEEKLEKILKKKEQFCGALDFNSLLPRMVMEDDTPYLNALGVPFYNYLVDHPLYHHPGLMQPIADYHILCIDSCHAAYVKQYYPNIKSVHVLPLGGMEASYQRSCVQKRFELLFLGTYVPASNLYEEIQGYERVQREETKNLIERMEADVELTQEEALAAFLEERGEVISREAFAIRLNRSYLADKYLIFERRRRIICAAAKAKVPFAVVGHGWEQVDFSNTNRPQLKRGVGFSTTAELIADAKILLNANPGFHGGIHDRVFSAMLNHTVCLEEDTRFSRAQFAGGETIAFYDMKKLEKLPELVESLAEDAKLQNYIVNNAHQLAGHRYTWKSRAKEFMAILGEDSSGSEFLFRSSW